jgi:hypothetical protein
VSSIYHRCLSVVALCVLLLGALAPATAGAAGSASTLRFSRDRAAPGDQVIVTGSGFAPNATAIISGQFDVAGKLQQVQTSAQTTSSGGFTATLAVPPQSAPGVYSVKARDDAGHAASRSLNVLALLLLKPGAAPPLVTIVSGHYFYVAGTGFKPLEAVHITGTFPQYNGNLVSIDKTVSANANGNVAEVLFQMPATPRSGASLSREPARQAPARQQPAPVLSTGRISPSIQGPPDREAPSRYRAPVLFPMAL